MERNSVIVRIFGRFVVNRGPTITVDVRLDLGETLTKGPLKVRATSSPNCTTVHYSFRRELMHGCYLLHLL